MHRIGLKVLQATVGVESNTPALLPRLPFPLEVKSLLTDFHKVEEIAYSPQLDGQIILKDSSDTEPACLYTPEQVHLRGPLLDLERGASDLRYSLWGNQGFLYRYILFLLERRHGIFSLHACAVLDERRRRLYVVAGGAGSGKTVYLLSGLERGLKLFSTETVHYACQAGSLFWFMGSLVDNIRLGNLVRDFPRFKPAETPALGADLWQKKIAVDLSAYKAADETLHDPEVVILFPRIEEGWPESRMTSISDKRKATHLLFENISQKIAETVVLYDRLVLPGLDEESLARRRLEMARILASHSTVGRLANVLSDPAHCWGGLLDEMP
ncbi:MAG TPA: hypothetical protein VGB72_06640 [Acidobacteriota bacterium]